MLPITAINVLLCNCCNVEMLNVFFLSLILVGWDTSDMTWLNVFLRERMLLNTFTISLSKRLDFSGMIVIVLILLPKNTVMLRWNMNNLRILLPLIQLLLIHSYHKKPLNCLILFLIKTILKILRRNLNWTIP